MNAADAVTLVRSRPSTLLAIGIAIVALLVAGSCWDGRRAAYADGELHVLDQQLAAAQHERHAASVAAIAAHRSLDSATHHADSIVARADVAEKRSRQLAQQVRVLDTTHLAVRMTASSADTVIAVPPPVAAYIVSLESTVAAKDSALQARDGQVATSVAESAALRRELAADSVTIGDQAQENAALKDKVPRFGFKSGVVAGVSAVLIVAKIALLLVKH